MRRLAVVALALLPIAAVPLVGAWALAVSGLLLALVGLRATGRRSWARPAQAVGLLGSGVGLLSAGQALVEVGGAAPYRERAGLGWAALALACVAGLGSLLAPARPVVGSALILAGGLAGTVAINLFSINTFYVLAMVPWVIGAALALLEPGGARASGQDPSS